MISELRLTHFRSFEEASLTFSPLTAIIGKNGVGKTSVLEAIYMLSLTTSWKTEKDTEVIRFGHPFTRILSGQMELVIQAHPYMKRMKLDGVSRRAHQVIGEFPTILFQPDDMDLLYGSPSFRRQYIDRIISQTSPQYTQAVLQAGKVLKQRNRLLKNIQEGLSGEDELLFWDQELAGIQAVTQERREVFLEAMQTRVPGLFADMVPGGGDIAIRYHRSPADREHGFLEHLARNHQKEIAAGNSLYGPHREDIDVVWGGHPASECMSRGQSRSLLIAFKIAELEFVTAATERRPVLLLDDIFSELDGERRQRLFTVFGDYQVILTTTELGPIQGLLGGEATVIEL